MQQALSALVTALALALVAVPAGAAPIDLGGGITVTCTMTDGSACNQSNMKPLQFVINEPANETTTEPGIVLTFNVAFAKTGVADLFDKGCSKTEPLPIRAGCLSDQFSFTNPGGKGTMTFLSDPNPSLDPSKAYTAGTCVENPTCAVVGFVGVSKNRAVAYRAGSDAENAALASDSLTVNLIPEPWSFALFGGALVITALARRRRSRPRLVDQRLATRFAAGTDS